MELLVSAVVASSLVAVLTIIMGWVAQTIDNRALTERVLWRISTLPAILGVRRPGKAVQQKRAGETVEFLEASRELFSRLLDSAERPEAAILVRKISGDEYGLILARDSHAALATFGTPDETLGQLQRFFREVTESAHLELQPDIRETHLVSSEEYRGKPPAVGQYSERRRAKSEQIDGAPRTQLFAA